MVGPLDMGGPILGNMPWALDNGAWPAHASGQPWNEPAFVRALGVYGPGADFIVIPDVVADADRSFARSIEWLPELLQRPDIAGSRLLFAVQDGMTFDQVAPWIGGRVGIFIGGSTEWKVASILPWGRFAKQLGVYCHVGRVNSAKRIALCAAAGVDSFDGTSATRFAKTLPLLAGAARQSDMFAGVAA